MFFVGMVLRDGPENRFYQTRTEDGTRVNVLGARMRFPAVLQDVH